MKEAHSQVIFELCGGRLPEQKTEGAAAYDLYCPSDTVIQPGRQKICLGFMMQFSPDLEALIEARSGFELNGFEGYWTGDKKMEKPYRFDADVLTGKVDSDFDRPVSVIIKSHEKFPFVCKAGTRLAQMTFVKIEHPEFIVGIVEPSETRFGGFGSTGTH